VRQFEVHTNPSPRSRAIIPYFVVLQSHLLAASNLTVVAPLLRQDPRSAFTLTSVPVHFADDDYVLLVGELTSIESQHLVRPAGSLQAYEDEIRRALDRVFTGF
jgi:toxin CcdB